MEKDLFALAIGIALLVLGILVLILSKASVWKALDEHSLATNPIRRLDGLLFSPKFEAAFAQVIRISFRGIGVLITSIGVAIIVFHFLKSN